MRTEEDDSNDSWEVRMARRYYAKLFKEYAIADLSRYKVYAHQFSCTFGLLPLEADPFRLEP